MAVKTRDCMVFKGLPLYQKIPTFNDPEKNLLKTLWEKETRGP